MLRLIACSTALLAFGGGIAMADPHGSGPFDRIEGRISLTHSDGDAPGLDPEDFLFFDVEGELSFDPDNRFGVGFDIWALTDFEDKPVEYVDVYLFYNFGSGSQVQLGYAQPATDLFLSDRAAYFGGFSQNAFFGQLVFLESTVRRLSLSDDPALGLSYFGDYGAIEVAASAHFNQVGDGALYGLALLYNASEAIELFVGTEILDSDTAPSNDPRYWLGGRYTQNGLTAEVLYSGNILFAPGAEAAQLSAFYEIPGIDGLTVGGSYMLRDGGGGATHIARIGAEMDFGNGVSIGGNVQRINAFGPATTLWGIEASFRF